MTRNGWTLNTFSTLILCFIYDFEHVNVCWTLSKWMQLTRKKSGKSGCIMLTRVTTTYYSQCLYFIFFTLKAKIKHKFIFWQYFVISKVRFEGILRYMWVKIINPFTFSVAFRNKSFNRAFTCIVWFGHQKKLFSQAII